MKSEGMLAVKIIEIDCQHTPHLGFACPEQKESTKILRIKQSPGFTNSGVHKSYFKAFLSYLGFQVANAFTFTYWSPE